MTEGNNDPLFPPATSAAIDRAEEAALENIRPGDYVVRRGVSISSPQVWLIWSTHYQLGEHRFDGHLPNMHTTLAKNLRLVEFRLATVAEIHKAGWTEELVRALFAQHPGGLSAVAVQNATVVFDTKTEEAAKVDIAYEQPPRQFAMEEPTLPEPSGFFQDLSQAAPPPSVRTFTSGATRDQNATKFAYTRHLDPAVLTSFVAYMHKHRIHSDGTPREPDNWKHGFGLPTLMESLGRHFWELWTRHEDNIPFGKMPDYLSDTERKALLEACNGILFNTMSYMRELNLANREPLF